MERGASDPCGAEWAQLSRQSDRCNTSRLAASPLSRSQRFRAGKLESHRPFEGNPLYEFMT